MIKQVFVVKKKNKTISERNPLVLYVVHDDGLGWSVNNSVDAYMALWSWEIVAVLKHILLFI